MDCGAYVVPNLENCCLLSLVDVVATVAALLDVVNVFVLVEFDRRLHLFFLPPAMPFTFRRRTLSRLISITFIGLFLRWLLSPPPTHSQSQSHQIVEHNFIERATRPDKSLNVQRHHFLQSRMGRDERDDMFSALVQDGARDYWERFQLP